MTVKTERYHRGEFLLEELPGIMSRKEVTILSGQSVVAGEVLGQVTIAGATAAAKAGGNTGDGTVGTITVAAGAKQGVYRLTFIEPAGNLGTFQVEDPAGVNVGTGVVGSAFSGGGLTFTVADGDADFIAGDAFDITVAAGSLKWVAYDQDASTGAQIAAAIAYDAVDASAADKVGVIIFRDADVDASALTWPSDIEAGEKTAALASLAALGIRARS